MRLRPQPTALLIDFDGVLRHQDPSVVAEVERAHGLEPGSFAAAQIQVAERGLDRQVVLGEITNAQWLAGFAEALGSLVAVQEWQRYRGDLDPAVVEFVREAKAMGVPVVLVTNATDALDSDLRFFGLTDDFHAVVNSSVIGVAKPAREFFVAACEAVPATPEHCLLVDDLPRNVDGGRAAGLAAHRYNGPADLAYLRAALALQVR